MKPVELVTPYAPEEFRVFGPVSLKVAAAAGEEGARGAAGEEGPHRHPCARPWARKVGRCNINKITVK